MCLPEDEISDDQMLLIAQELNLSETAVLHHDEPAERYRIKFFFPLQKIPLCGHATLAAAKVLFEQLGVRAVDFVNIDGLELSASKAGKEIVLRFPVYETRSSEAPDELLAALGIESVLSVEY